MTTHIESNDIKKNAQKQQTQHNNINIENQRNEDSHTQKQQTQNNKINLERNDINIQRHKTNYNKNTQT